MKLIFGNDTGAYGRCAMRVVMMTMPIAAMASPGLAQRPPVASSATVIGPTVDASKLDIAGVSLGMSRQQAAAAAVAASYRCRVLSGTDSYDEAMTVAVMERHGKASNPMRVRSGIETLRCGGSSGSTMDIDFGQVPTGQVVSHVTLAMDPQRMDAAAVLERAMAKYGRPSITHGDWSAWCTPEPGRFVVNRQCEASRSSLKLGRVAGVSLNLSEGGSTATAREAAFRTEVERRAPASTRPSF